MRTGSMTIYSGRMLREFQENQLSMEDVLSSVIGMTDTRKELGEKSID